MEGRPRLVGIDVARAVAMLGVVTMNYTEVFNRSDLGTRGVGEGPRWLEELLAPFDGPLTTRFAATFVTIAGIGVVLLTARARRAGDAEALRADRWRLRRRGVLLFAFGYAFEWIWPGQILSYYGAYLTLASFPCRGGRGGCSRWPPRSAPRRCCSSGRTRAGTTGRGCCSWSPTRHATCCSTPC